MWFTQNYLGKELTSYLDYRDTYKTTVIANQDLLRIKVALLEYQLIHGTLPNSLTVEMLKNDPFGKTDHDYYHYSKQKRQLWSVGQDFTDSNNLLNTDDITYQIPTY